MKEIDKWVSTAKLILDTNKNEDLSFTSIESLYELSQDFRIESETTIKIQNAIKPIINWKEDAEKFIEKNTNKMKSKNKKRLKLEFRIKPMRLCVNCLSFLKMN